MHLLQYFMTNYLAILFENCLTSIGQLFQQIKLLFYVVHFGLDVGRVEVATVDQSAAQLPQSFHIYVETIYITLDNVQFLYQTLNKRTYLFISL